MWEYSHVCLEPQPLRHGIVLRPKNSDDFPILIQEAQWLWLDDEPSFLSTAWQLMNGLKHIVFVWRGCGSHSMYFEPQPLRHDHDII